MIIRILAWPMGQIMRLLYQLTADYGMTTLLFAVAIKLIMLPLSIIQQKNAIKMVRIQPQLNDLNVRYASDQKKLIDEQFALYKREKYRPLLGLVPTLLQVPIIIGLINVVYNPFKWLLHIGDDVIMTITDAACAMRGVETLGAAGQLQIAGMLRDSQFAGQFHQLSQSGASVQEAVARVQTLDFHFCGWDLSQTPTLQTGAWLLAVPVLAILSTLLLCVLQNRFNVLSREQGKLSQWGMTAFLTLFILVFAFLVPAAISLYWAFGNLVSVVIMFCLNAAYPPKKYIDYDALEKSKVALERARAAQKAAMPTAGDRKREKADYKRFFAPDNEKKELVFYSVKSGFYRYFKDVIEYILENSDIIIHYVTSDPKDIVFGMDNPRLIPYYIQGNNLIYLFMKVDTDVMVMTMPEIGNYHYKRSLVRKDIDYVYLFHALVSTHMIYRKGAFDHYDTILCCGPHHMREIRETEQLYHLPEKRLIEFGYPLLDDLRESFKSIKKDTERFQILIAPSHHEGNIMDSCIEEVLEQVLDKGYYVIIRPHPQYVKRCPDKIAVLQERYGCRDDVKLETDFSTNDSQYTSDIMITDWSGISLEYSFATRKPCVFINTPMKVLNPEYKRIPSVPIQIALRDRIGVSVNLDELYRLPEVIKRMATGEILPKDEIEKTARQTVFHLDSHGTAGAQYIIETILVRRAKRISSYKQS